MSRFLAVLLVLATIAAEEDPAAPSPPVADAAFWGVVRTVDPAGQVAFSILGMSQAGTSAPEYAALQTSLDAAFQGAKTIWEEHRKAFEADPANKGKAFRKVEAEPVKPALKLAAPAAKEKAKAEAALAKLRQDEALRSNPGLERRRRVINEQLLQYFTIGIQATPEWIIETREQQGDRWACMAGYLSHVVDTPNDTEGKDTWFFKYGGLRAKFEGSRKAKVICWNTWYGLAEAPPAKYQPTPAAATPVNAKVQSTMIAYWSLVKKFLLMAKEFEDVDCVMQIEPDEWGHLLLSCGFDFNKEGVVLVGGSGMPELKGIPDTVKGYARAFRVLRDLYAPHVILAANPSAWDRNGSMSGERWGAYFKGMEVTADTGWDLFITQLHDWDRGQNRNGGSAKWPPYTEADTVTYHGSVDNWCAWIRPIHEATGMWGVAWQLPQGNWTYAACDGSDGHGMDNVTELLLDTYPANNVAQRMAASGCCMWIFSLGGAGANVFDDKKDGVTNPTPHAGNKGRKSDFPDDDGGYLRLKGADYFRSPVPIQGKALARKARKPAAEPQARSEPEASARPAPKLTDPKLRRVWVGRLRQSVVASLAQHREPELTVSTLKSKALVRSLSEDGVMTLAIAGSGEMAIDWGTLPDADLASLAIGIAGEGENEIQAIAGFFLLLGGREDAARLRLIRSKGHDDEVLTAFGLGQTTGTAP